jgi:23S rRNA pseudouridine955/2504/2580 synthase
VSPRKSITSPAQQVAVTQSGVDQRLDNYLIRMWKGVPRSHIYRLIREGQVRVNGSRSRVHRKLATGDILRLPPIRTTPKESMLIPEKFPALRECALYEDDSLLIIDKPAGVAVHGGSGLRGGVIEALRKECSPGTYLELVHRLDRHTSGCLMLAKDPTTLRFLHKSFRDHLSSGIQKKYQSLLVGKWVDGPRDIDLSLETIRSTNESRRSVVTGQGRHASSRFVPIQYFDEYVLVEIELRTGRMHQIRAHAAAIGYPVGGDRKYGSRDGNRRLQQVGLKRLFLHATEVELIHPKTGQKLVVKATLPDGLTEVLRGLS